MMMPHSIRDQRDAHFVHPPFPQLLYNSMPTPPLYDQSPLHLASQQFQQRQGPMFSSRPLFRTYSTSSPVPTQHSVQENLLRRKTPSGTLPAAYDAAPIEFVPRPNKQILLPCEETPLHIETGVHCWSNGAVYQVPGMGMGNGDGSGFSTEWPSMPKASLDNNLDPYARHFIQQQQNQHMAPPPFQESLWPNCQPTGFQSMYNPITQPTASYDEIAPAAASNHYYTTDVDRRKRSRSSKQESTTYPYIGTTSSHLNPGYAFPIPDANAGNIGMDMFGNESANYPMDSYTDTNLNGWHSAGIPTRNSLNIPNMEPFPNVSSAHLDPARALSTLSALEKLCGESNWTWLDGILLGGRLSYGLGDLNRASVWFRRVLDLDNG